ncbi:MAG: hypothetical protein K0R26_1879 [Bacteroidota bacterium]|jgi:hypothetical protein|nr:hypothetical protein [Bacteroidota bacterium]
MGTKFNLNRQPVPDEEINSHKDFGELVDKFKKQSIEKARSDANFLKNKKATYTAIIAGATVVCTLTYFTVFKKQTSKQNQNDKITTNQTHNNQPTKNSAKPVIAPPVPKLNVAYTSYSVKAEDGAVLKHKTNSKIIIPKKAFVNKQGLDIVGDVEIKYREFHNPADIIAGGVPMTYDSAGIKSTLESAGMIDIRGYQNGEPVFINPNKTITVEFQSEYISDQYNMYVLDTMAGNWVYVSRDNSLKNQKKNEPKKTSSLQVKSDVPMSAKQKDIQKQIDAIPPKMEAEKIVYSKKINQLPKVTTPSKPIKATAGRPQFELDVNYKEFPELQAFKNAVFEVGSENKNYSSKLADITWSSAEVSEGPAKGKNYWLTLKLRERVEKLIVYPALAGSDYEKALKNYEAKFADYQDLLAKREADEKKLKEEFEAKQKAYVQEQERLTAEMIRERIRIQKEIAENMNQQMKTMSSEAKVTRIFNVSNFGICNSDRPVSMPQEAKMNPVFIVNGTKTFVKANSTYLISKNRNLVFNFGREPLSYNPGESYSLCVISDGKIYTCDSESLSKCFAAKQNKIPVTEVTAEINDSHDLKKVLGI